MTSNTYNNFELVILKEQFTDEILSKIKGLKYYAYILHDKDLNTKPHYHIYIGGFGSTISHISNYFNLHPNFINILKGSKKNILKYFIHDIPNLNNKYQYARR